MKINEYKHDYQWIKTGLSSDSLMCKSMDKSLPICEWAYVESTACMITKYFESYIHEEYINWNSFHIKPKKIVW